MRSHSLILEDMELIRATEAQALDTDCHQDLEPTHVPLLHSILEYLDIRPDRSVACDAWNRLVLDAASQRAYPFIRRPLKDAGPGHCTSKYWPGSIYRSEA